MFSQMRYLDLKTLPNSKHNSSNSSVVYLSHCQPVPTHLHHSNTYSRPSSLKSAALSTEIVGIMRGPFFITPAQFELQKQETQSADTRDQHCRSSAKTAASVASTESSTEPFQSDCCQEESMTPSRQKSSLGLDPAPPQIPPLGNLPPSPATSPSSVKQGQHQPQLSFATHCSISPPTRTTVVVSLLLINHRYVLRFFLEDCLWGSVHTLVQLSRGMCSYGTSLRRPKPHEQPALFLPIYY